MFVRLLFETVQLHVYIFKRLGGKTIKMNICTCYIMFKKYSDAEEIKWILEEDSLTLQPFQIQSSFFVNKSDEVLPNISLLISYKINYLFYRILVWATWWSNILFHVEMIEKEQEKGWFSQFLTDFHFIDDYLLRFTN